MNRKIIAFLSVFSLVLVLSIYYVMLPFNPNTGELPVNNNTPSTVDAYFAALEVAREDNLEQYIKSMNAIIASATATNDEKIDALANIAAAEALAALETKTKNELVVIGYPKVFVEKVSATVSVVVAKTGFTYSDAAAIIATVYQNFGTQVLVEVSPTN